MTVWLKITLVLIYLTVLFILARLFEAVVWYEQGQISRRLLDPMAMSVMKLKALLEQRGVSYDSMVEKSELSELVESTGSVTEEDMEAATILSEDEVQITNYTSDIDFYEQVEDAKDSMWLVEIMTDNGRLLSDTSWHLIRKKVGKFGVRFGRFNCQQHVRLCTRRGWFTSRLVLALPENYRSKANVALDTYPGPIKINSLFNWIKLKVNGQVKSIDDEKELNSNWLSFESTLSPDVRVIFVSTITSVPLFLSALSVKFPGRVKIGCVKLNTAKGKHIAHKLDVKTSPSYLVITKDGKYKYGATVGEIKSFQAFEMFLKTVYPSMNDLFIVSIILTNIASVFEISLCNGGIVTRLVKFFLCMFKYNLILFLVWICLLALLQIPIFGKISLGVLRYVRYITMTPLFAKIRKDMVMYTNEKVILLAVLSVVCGIAAYIKMKYFMSDEDYDEDSDWWNFSNLRTLNYYNGSEMMRFRPFDQIFNPSFGGPATHDDSETPQTVNSTEYLKLLPVWNYQNIDCEFCLKNGREVGGKSNETKQTVYKSSDMDEEPNFPESGNGSECICGSNASNTIPNDILPPEISKCNIMEPLLGSTFDNPWDGVQKNGTSVKLVKNLNRNCHKPSGYLLGTQCTICLDHYVNSVVLRGLPCKHVFHDKCILAWLLRDNHFCPVCRWPAFQPKEMTYKNELHCE
ncbi:hypothetical protein ACF0H5_009027 [Mactra antiquata]